MHTMGGSVKRFYSDVVLDLLPLVDAVKHEAQEVAMEKNDATGTYIKSVMGIGKNSANTMIKQSQEEANPIDQMKNQLGHAVNGLDHENRLITPTAVDPVDGLGSDLVLGKIDDDLTYEICDLDVEENVIKEKLSTSKVLELVSPGEKNSSEALASCESVATNNKNACEVGAEISHATSVNVVEFQPTQIVDTVCDNLADDSVSVSDTSNTSAASKVALSVASCEEKMSETRLISSSYSRSMESSDLHGNSLDYLTTEAVPCTDVVDEVEVYDSGEAIPSSTSSPIVSHKDKEAEFINSSSVLSLKPIGLCF